MESVIGWMVTTFRMNGIVTFSIMVVLCLYVTIVGISNVSAIYEALWYASAFDCFISAAIVIGLKNRKGV